MKKCLLCERKMSGSNNFAMIATSCNVVHEYNIAIKFQIKDWK